VTAHLLCEDFFRFLDALSRGAADAWDAYEEHYLNPNRSVLEAWWDQCMVLPRQAWQERVRRVRPGDYGLLRDIAQESDLQELARDAMARCQAVLPLKPEPDIYYLVGFFSPDGFAFQVDGDWAIGIGMERLGNLNLVPILLAHEYAHCYRRRMTMSARLGERLVEEGFAVELAARAFPERPEHDHLLMHAGQVAAMRSYEEPLWRVIVPLLDSEDDALAARVLYGRTESGQTPSRAGMYLGRRLVQRFMAQEPGSFDAPAGSVLAARDAEGRRQP